MSSSSLGKLAEALAKAQGEMSHAAKDKDNPFFKSTYADLASVWDACRGPLSRNNLCVVQTLDTLNNEIVLKSTLAHSSGEFMESIVPIIPVKKDPQGYGSAITYMRRFALSALVGIAPSERPTEDDLDDDDDGQAAVGRPIPPVQKSAPSIVKPVDERMVLIKQVSDLLKELNISSQEAQEVLTKDCHAQSLKTASLEQLTQFLGLLLKEKAERQQEQAKASIEQQEPIENTFQSFN